MNPNQIYQTFMEAGTDWSEKHGAAELLEGMLKSLKAQLALEACDVDNCSMAKATDIALASDRYKNALRDAVEARTEANRAKVRYDSVKSLFEAQRTAEASERAAMRSAT